MWISTVDREQATGLLAELYDANIRPGRPVSDRVKAFSLRPEALAADFELREVIGLPKGGLSLGSRRAEMIATAVSGMTACAYCGVWHSRTLISEGGASDTDALACYSDWRPLEDVHSADVVSDFVRSTGGRSSAV